jgi:alpha-amylase
MKTLSISALALASLVGFTTLASCVDVSPAPTDFKTSSHVDDWRDEVIYQVLIDRFADGDVSNDYRVNRAAPARYHGGDWKGLADRLDYISALGVTALWISPIVRNVETDAGIDSYHGYWTQDPFALNPHFGNLSDLRDLVSKAHAKNIKIVLDIVTNHMGQLFYYDINMNGRPDEDVRGGLKTSALHLTEYDPDYEDPQVMAFTSLGIAGPAPIVFFDDQTITRMPPADPRLATPEAYHRRGRIVNYDSPPDGREQTLFGDFPGGLKDLNTESPAVVDAMVEAYGKWIALADLDGFRIDTVKHIDHPFWQQFNARLRAKAAQLGKPKFLMFGEVFDGRDDLVGSYTKDKELDGLFDFPQYFQVFRDVFIGGAPTKKIADRWDERAKNWSTSASDGGLGIAPSDLHVNFLDNHDVGRYLWQATTSGRSDSHQVLLQALTFLLTEDGIPCIYYGTEQDFSGGNDPANREDLWNAGYKTTGDTFQKIARLTRVRRASKALRQGVLSFAWTSTAKADEPGGGIIAFERVLPEGPDAGYALVVINTSATQKSATNAAGVAMKLKAKPGTELEDFSVTTGGRVFPVGADGSLNVELAPLESVVLLPRGTKI